MTTQAHGTFRCNEAPRVEMRRLVEEGAAGVDLSTEVLDDLLLAVWEASAQATSHSGHPEVEVTVRTSKHAVEIEIRNPGVYRVERHAAESKADQRLDVALTMAMEMSLVDQIHVDPGTEERPGTVIRIVKLIGA